MTLKDLNDRLIVLQDMVSHLVYGPLRDVPGDVEATLIALEDELVSTFEILDTRSMWESRKRDLSQIDVKVSPNKSLKKE